MTWDELQPRFREAVLAERASGRSTEDIAEELHTGRSTVFRMLADEVTPTRATQAFAEEFVESHMGRLAEDQAEG